MIVPAHVGVIGGGRMGAGIAHAFLLAGASVTILERDEEAAAHALAALSTAIDASIARGTSEESRDDLVARSASTVDVADLAGSGLVVEAVPVPAEFTARSAMS